MNKNLLKTLIFIYMYSILFDGILRKWVFPSMSTPIMLIKQLVAILICAYGFPYLQKMTGWEKSFALLGLVVFSTSMMFGHQNLFVAFYGCLPYWFGLTVCFIIGKVLRYNDLLHIGRVLVYSTIVNSLLLILQFNLPVTHILNYQGGEVDASIVGYSVSSLEGGFRPSGLFVHNSQNALFQMIALSFILFLLFLRPVKKDRVKLYVALILNFVSVPFSVSRTNVFYQIGVVTFFLVFCQNRWKISRIIKYVGGSLAVAAVLVLFIPPLNAAMHTIWARFANASVSQFRGTSTIEGTILDLWNRNVLYTLRAMFNPVTLDGDSVPFLGFGQGMSTQVGGRILGLTRNSGFSLAEWDGLRIVCESGLLLGWIIIFIRVAYAFRYILYVNSYRRRSKTLALLLLIPFLVSFNLLNNWGNLFQANMSFLIGGMFLAASKYRILDGH